LFSSLSSSQSFLPCSEGRTTANSLAAAAGLNYVAINKIIPSAAITSDISPIPRGAQDDVSGFYSLRQNYFAGGGGLSPLFFVSVVVDCVVVPSGVETVVFFVAEDFSEQPIAPTAITPINKTALIMRFMS
jgi:hypothetical protein